MESSRVNSICAQLIDDFFVYECVVFPLMNSTVNWLSSGSRLLKIICIMKRHQYKYYNTHNYRLKPGLLFSLCSQLIHRPKHTHTERAHTLQPLASGSIKGSDWKQPGSLTQFKPKAVSLMDACSPILPHLPQTGCLLYLTTPSLSTYYIILDPG